MSILSINDLALELVKKDFSDGHKPNNAGPTKTSRALAIIHLAAHDAYAKVTSKFPPRLSSLPNPPQGIGDINAAANAALLSAGILAAEKLYPDFVDFIAKETACLTVGLDPQALGYGQLVATAWLNSRSNDGSNVRQVDRSFSQEPGRHRPDPLAPDQEALGRTWGSVTPFVLSSVPADAPLERQPALTDPGYTTAFKQVLRDGKADLVDRDPPKAVVGIFWGYDGANQIGVPPRLYNQIVRAIPEVTKLPLEKQIRLLTAINVAMADAGIAAWYWKYEYDFWRPVVGIREANAGWGPTGKGDGNDDTIGDPFWLPLGAPSSNPVKIPAKNGTPGFPAYPSGHATFGAACFNVAATLLGKHPKEIEVKFVSDEFNGVTTDNNGVTRPKYQDTFNLEKAIAENNISRIYLGVHWIFDATGGEKVGTAIANKVSNVFK
jgi:hypothetical protein